MKLLGKTIWALLIILVLLLIGGTVFVLTFDANQYKTEIAEQVEQATGRALAIDGDISVSLFPWLGLEINQVALANAADFGQEPFAQVDKLAVKVELVPLLKKEISVDKVLLHGLSVSLQQNADGKNNWADLAKPAPDEADKDPAKKTTQSTSEQSSEAKSEFGLAALAVNGLEVKDATLVWQDDLAGSKITLDQVDLESGAIVLGELIPLKLSAHAKLNQPDADIKLALNTQLKFDLAAMHLMLSDLDVQLHASTPELAAQQAVVKLNTALDAKLNEQQFKLQNFNVAIDAKGSELPGGEVDVRFSSVLDVDVKKQTASLSNAQIETLGLKVVTSVTITQLLETPLLKGKFSLAEFNPSLLPSQLGIELPPMQDPAALQKARLAFQYEASPEMLRLDALQLKLDESVMSGWLHVLDFNQPILRYQLALNKIKLDAYLPPPAQPVVVATKQSVAAQKPDQDIPVDLPIALLRKINLQGDFTADEIQAFDQQLNNLRFTVKGKQGVLRIHPLHAQVLDGHIELSAKLDVRTQLPQYAVDVNAKQLAAAPVVNPMLQDMLGEKAVSVNGAANLATHLTTQGDSVNKLKAGLNGQINLNVGQASLQGVDTEYFVRKAVVDYLQQKKKQVPQSWHGEYDPRQTTAFNMMRASGQIKNGVLSNKDLLLDSKRLKVTGAGTVNIVTSTMDYRMVVDVQPTRKKTAADKLLDIPMPIKVQGEFARPQVSIESKTWKKAVSKALKKEAKAKAESRVDEKKDALRDKYKDKLKDKLKGLFK